MNKAKAIVISVIFCALIGLLTVLHFVLPDEELSLSERRKKQQFPEVSVSSLLNGDFTKQLEAYMADQFPLRDTFRRLKAGVHFKILGQKDNDSVYAVDGNIGEYEGSIDKKSVDNFTKKITSVYQRYLKNTDCKVYYSIIPDKNRFLAKSNGYPCFDYNEMYSMVDEKLSFMTKIEIYSLLSLDCYYKTDSHWRQEKILPVAKRICESMNVKHVKAEKQKNLGEFYGVYYPRLALDVKSDELITVENEAINKSKVYIYDTDKTVDIYNQEKLKGNDPYEVFLSGSVGMLEINNPTVKGERELVIFRDSFSSSLAPLLLGGYSKITLVDIRYVTPSYMATQLEFENQDVLFIYSTMLINNSQLIK